MTDNTQLACALQYASIGWHVFPVSADKKPLVASGFHAATTEIDQIVEWWGKFESAGVGVACLKSCLFVVDLDRNHGNARDGVQAWEFAQQDFGSDERGLMASTPLGGQHIVYRHPGYKIKTCNNALPDSGVDCRGDGGYFIAPSPVDPGRQWEEGDPFDIDGDGATAVTDAPKWVLDIMTAGRETSTSISFDTSREMSLSDEEVARIRSALSSVSNDDYHVWVQVGMALKSTFAKSQAYNLWAEWSADGYAEFNDHDARVKWVSFKELRMDGSEVTLGTLFHLACSNGWVDTSGLPDVAPEPSEESSGVAQTLADQDLAFPAELLNAPGLLGDLANYIGYKNKAYPQPALGFGSALAIFSGIAGSIVRSSEGQFSHLYVIGLGESGCGKDASKQAVAELMRDIGRDKVVASSDWTSDTALRRELSNQDEDDVNTHYGRVAAIDEFGDWLTVTNDASSNNKIAMRALFLEVWGSGVNTTIQGTAYANQKERPTINLTSPCLTIYGTSTPDKVYSALGSKSMTDGLANRMLYIRVDDDIPEDATPQMLEFVPSKDAIVRRLKDVADWIRPEGFIGGVGHYEPIEITYTDEASKRLRDLSQEIKQARRDARANASHSVSMGSGLWVRGAELVRRVATIAAVADKMSEIGIGHIELAETFVKWSIRRTESSMATSGGDNEYEALQRRILKVIKEHGGRITRSGLSKTLRSYSAKQRGEAIAHLIEAGDISEVKSEAKKSGGPSPTTYSIRK